MNTLGDLPRHVASGVVALLMLVLAGCGSGDQGASPSTTSSTTPTTGSTSRSPSTVAGLHLVALGDSIPYNSSNDCPGCTGFVQRYASALEDGTGEKVTVTNLSEHTDLTLPRLLDELGSFRDDVASADVVLVAIAHNSNELNADAPCGTARNGNVLDWSVVNARCAVAAAERYRPQFERLYSTIAGWRRGKPTILLTVNRYNDYIGLADARLTKAQARKSALVIAEWNRVLCASAKSSGFRCVDLAGAFNGPEGLRASGDLLANDYTHPSDKGNALIARVLVKAGFSPLTS